jgi:hypothetical protein
LKLPAHVLFRRDLSLILWTPRGILDESTVNEIIAFIEDVEKRNREPLNRFADLSALDAVDLNFDFALLRLAGVSRPRLGGPANLMGELPGQTTLIPGLT